MAVWRHHLKLGDVFHNDDLTFMEKRDIIAKRIHDARWFDVDDPDIEDVWSSLAECETPAEFDVLWGYFYDWCDDHRVWVETWAPVSA